MAFKSFRDISLDKIAVIIFPSDRSYAWVYNNIIYNTYTILYIYYTLIMGEAWEDKFYIGELIILNVDDQLIWRDFTEKQT